MKQSLKLLHWNAGNSWWESKRTEIQALIFESATDLMFISEANLRTNTPPELTNIQGYYMVTPKTDIQMGYSRIVLLAREGVRLSIMDDCMDGNIPSIWVKVTSRGRKALVIGGSVS